MFVHSLHLSNLHTLSHAANCTPTAERLDIMRVYPLFYCIIHYVDIFIVSWGFLFLTLAVVQQGCLNFWPRSNNVTQGQLLLLR